MEKTFIVTVWEKEHWVVARCSEVDVTGTRVYPEGSLR